MIAHIGTLPPEELLPVVTGAGSGLLAVRDVIPTADDLRRRPCTRTSP